MANTFQLISSATANGSQSSITFSSIPQTYADLALHVSARTTAAGSSQNFSVRYNGDTTGNYSTVGMYGDGASTVSAFGIQSQGQSAFLAVNMNTSPANIFANTEVYIPNYAATTLKQIFNNGNAGLFATPATENRVGSTANFYRGTAAITSILITTTNGTDLFTTGSTFYLYGIKKS